MALSSRLISNGFHLPYNSKLTEKAKELRHNMTAPERKLWYEYLRNFPIRFLRQKPIDEYIVDFYCSRLKLVIEIDGESHFSIEGEEKDATRTMILQKKYGLTVLRFSNTDVMRSFEGVCEVIQQCIDSGIPPTPLQRC